MSTLRRTYYVPLFRVTQSNVELRNYVPLFGVTQSNVDLRNYVISRQIVIQILWYYWIAIGIYRDVWIAAIASSRKSPATQTAAICVRFQGRRVRHVYVTMPVTFLTHKSALIYRRGLRQRVASLTLDCNGVFAIRAY